MASSQIVTLATCSLDQWANDFEGNLRRVKQSIVEAKALGAKYRVGPELELCGYGCEDHFLENDTFVHSLEGLADLLESGIMEGILCDIGLPVLFSNVRYNCRAICIGKRILCIRPKLFLAGDGNYREPRYFSRWTRARTTQEYRLPPMLSKVTGQISVPFGDCGVRTRETVLAPESCEELFTPASPNIYLSLAGVEIISNGSGSHHQLRKLNTRVDLIKGATARNGGVYLYANQLGCDGSRLLFDGCALIAVNGEVVAQGSQFSLKDVEVVVATVDLDKVRSYRCYRASRGVQAALAEPIPLVDTPSEWSMASPPTTRCSPPIPVKYHTPEEEIALGPACWLWDYLRRSGASGYFLPLSGGADSSSTLAIAGSMCQMVVEAVADGDAQVLEDARRIAGGGADYVPTDAKEFASRILHTGYLGTSNSSDGTRTFARQLAEAVGTYHLCVDIDPVVGAIIKLFMAATGMQRPRYHVHGGTRDENLALQNIQARFRMLFSYMLAQLLPWARSSSGFLLVLGSANVDEALRGYMTKYDCSSADVNPIGGISKTDLKGFLSWASRPDTLGYGVLKAISEAPPTAELEPITDAHAQTDEEDMGMTYEELSWYGRLRKIHQCGPVSMFRSLLPEWPHLSPREVATKVKFFFRQYSINRHKMTTLTPSYHAEMYSPDDNRFDLRQFLYNTRWPWQFSRIDALVRDMESEANGGTAAKD